MSMYTEGTSTERDDFLVAKGDNPGAIVVDVGGNLLAVWYEGRVEICMIAIFEFFAHPVVFLCEVSFGLDYLGELTSASGVVVLGGLNC